MSRARILTLVAVLALVVAGGVEGGPYLWGLLRYGRHVWLTAPREPGALADWRQTFGDPDALLASYARADDNATAVRLAALAKPLGIDLRPDSSTDGNLAGLGTYVGIEDGKGTDDPPGPPPAPARAYLDAHRAAIAPVVDLLTTAELPAWKCDMSATVPRSSASLLGIFALNNVLAADAFDEATQGHAIEAGRAMRAAWQLGQSARGELFLISELMTMRFASTNSALVRRLSADAGAWRPELVEDSYPARLERALEAETVWRVRVDGGRSMTTRAYRADYLDGTRANLLRMRTLSLTEEPHDSPVDLKHLPWWMPGKEVAMIATAGLEHAWLVAHGVMLDLELTDRVLDAQQVKAKTGRWPDVMPEVASADVPGARWAYAVSSAGVISISLNRPLPAYQGRPLTFHARR